MKKLIALVRKVKHLLPQRKAKGFAEFPFWFNTAILATFSAWVYLLGTPTGEAFRQFDRIATANGMDAVGWLVLAFLLIVAASLLYATILAAAALKAIVDRLQKA